MTVRYATIDDLPDVVNLIMKRGDGFDYEKHGFPLPDRRVVTRTVVNNWHKSPCFVYVKDSRVIGCASTCIFNFGWSDEDILSTFMLYVLPEHRKHDIVKSLYGSIKDYADRNGLLYADDYIAIDRVAARQRLMRSLDFQQSGFLFTYNGKVENGR